MRSPEPSEASPLLPTVLRKSSAGPIVLTCEHASPAVPAELEDLGVSAGDLRDHIGWDIGAARLTGELSAMLGAAAVLSPVNRLVVDCNRRLTDDDLIPAVSHGVAVPANRGLSVGERERRLASYYHPYHEAIDRVAAMAPRLLLLSVHSFTPSYDGRDFDVGVLFDDYTDRAEQLAAGLRAADLAVRMNEPYSGADGLIHSAQLHGRRAGCVYLEIELNNGRLREDDEIRDYAGRIAPAVERLAADLG